MTISDGALRLVVLGDSFAFTDDRGPQLPSAPHLWPNVAGRAIAAGLDREVDVAVVGRAGWNVRDAWSALTKDRHVMFEVVARADATIVSFGSFDHGPLGMPAPITALLPYLRPAGVRRRARRAVRTLHPMVARVTRGRYPITPRREFVERYDAVLAQVRGLARNAAGVVVGPSGHDSAYYARINRHRDSGERAQFDIAARHGFATIACWPLVEPHLERLNPDGIHWPADVHEAVGEAIARPLVAQLRGDEPRPPNPWPSLR